MMAYRSGIYTVRAAACPQVHLGLPGQYMSYRRPVNQILAMEDRDAGKILKRAVNQIVIIIYADYTWIWIVAGDHGVPDIY
jgi:hypothetical protein